ncbi:MAG: TRAP transporter small permease subunit [Pseudomonadota bacterium]
MGALLSLGDVLDRISRSVGKAASFLILPLIFLIMFDVITRKIDYIKEASAEITINYGFSVSFILQDLQWHVHGALMLLTFGFGYLANSHVRVDIFREGLARRSQVWVETFGILICAVPFLLLMIWFSYVMASASFAQGEGSESQVGLGWRWIIKSFLIWGFLIALMAALATLFRCLNFLFGNYEQQAIAEDQLQFFTDVETLPKVVLEDEEPKAEGRA